MKKNGFEVPKERRLIKQQRSVIIALAITYFEKYNSPEDSVEEIFNNVLNLLNEMFSDPIGIMVRGVSGGLNTLKEIFTRNKETLKEKIEKSITLDEFDDLEDMIADYVSTILEKVINKEAEYGDFLFIYPSRKFPINGKDRFVPYNIEEYLEANEIPYERVDTYSKDGTRIDNRRTADLKENVVRLMTTHASKGFDANHTFICGFDAIDLTQKDHPAELGYVALTRAKKSCNIGYFTESESTKHLKDVVDYLKQH